jgi:hypothetical protein
MLGEHAQLLEAAAVLHDIGYSPELVKTGLHPLDGARYLRTVSGADERVICLVAHHSCAWMEADARSLRDELETEFPREDALLNDALCYCDMCTTPDGAPTNPVDRINEIAERYGDDTLIGRFIRRAEPEILNATARTMTRVSAHKAATVTQPM